MGDDYKKIFGSLAFSLIILAVIWISTDNMFFKIISMMVILFGWFFTIIIPSVPKRKPTKKVPSIDIWALGTCSAIIVVSIILHMITGQALFILMIYFAIFISFLYLGLIGVIFKRTYYRLFYGYIRILEGNSARYLGFIYLSVLTIYVLVILNIILY